MRIRVVYGVHPSRCFGLSLGIDPILPPKRCIYDCIYCPTGRTISKDSTPQILVTPDRVIDELGKYIDVNGCIFSNIMIWGSGDPLLNYYTPLIASRIRDFIGERGCSVSITVRTTGYMLSEEWARQILPYVDRVLIPLDAGVDLRRTLNDPLKGYTLMKLVKILREIPRQYKRMIWYEINLLRTTTFTNASLYNIDELLSAITTSGITKIYVKTVDRPGKQTNIKPVRGKQIMRIIEKLENEGLKVVFCRKPSIENILIADNSDEAIINHLLRKPLSSDEIKQLYGLEGLRTVERLVAGNVLRKITWSNRVFFIAGGGLIQYMG